MSQGDQRRLLPHNRDAEEWVIGAILFAGRRAWDKVVGILRAEDFYNPLLGTLFEACAACALAGQPIDLLTVATKLRELQLMVKFIAVHEEVYLANLANSVSSWENIATHAQLVVDAAMARGVILAAGEIAEQAYAGVRGLDLLEAAQRRLFALGTRYQGLSEPKPLKKLLHAAYERLEKRHDEKKVVTGVPTGYRQLDEFTSGLQSGHFLVLCGRPGSGKSALAMQIGLHASVDHNTPVLVFHLEMTDDEVVDRAISSEARVPGKALRTGFMTSQHWIAISKAAPRMAEGPMWIDDSVPISVAAMAAKARRWRSDPVYFPPGKRPSGLVIVDYLQLVKASESRKNRLEEVSEVSHGLKALAKELQVPVLAVASLSRECEKRQDKRPIASDLRESGDIESDADLIMAVYRDELYDPDTEAKGIAELLIRKHRGGPLGTLYLEFDGPTMRFDDLDPARMPTQ